MIELKKFGEVCDFVRGPFGGSLKKSCFVEEGYAVYEQQHAIYNQFSDIRYFVTEDKFNEMKRFELKPNDLIMSCSGTMGKVAIVPEGIKQGIINQALLKLTPKDFLDIEYLKYWMSSPDFDNRIEENTVGAAIKNVASVKILKQIDVPVPPLEEQQQIVAILDDAFAAIEQAQANIEKNIDNAKELFQSKLNDIFSQTGEDWEEKAFSELFKLKSGDGLTAKNMIEGEFPVYGGNGISGYHNSYNKNGKYLIIGRVGALCGNVRYLNEKFWLTDNAFEISEMKVDFDYSFLYYLLNSKNLRSYARQAAQPVISNSSLKSVRISYPKSILVQKEYADTFRLLESKIEDITSTYESKKIKLEDLKKSLLEQAFAGKLTCNEPNPTH
jgi:type I restriction enzyme S subunit